jgi:hypothetical protein
MGTGDIEASDSRNFETLLDIRCDIDPRAALGEENPRGSAMALHKAADYALDQSVRRRPLLMHAHLEAQSPQKNVKCCKVADECDV